MAAAENGGSGGVSGIPPGPYRWQNVVIKGGGFVPGIVFSEAAPNLVYARTDVGGAYRYDADAGRWVPLMDWVGQADSSLMGIESIATDPVNAGVVYLAAGSYLTAGNGSILRSADFGQTWTRSAIGVPMGGNEIGRSMGERLAVDPNQPEILYFGARVPPATPAPALQLWRSLDSGSTWQQVTSFPALGDDKLGLSFVLFDASAGAPGAPTPTLYVGVATLTGDTLYVSRDAGSTWEIAPGPPPTGMMPHHAVLGSDGVMLLAYNNGPGPNDITGGALWRFDTTTGGWTQLVMRSHGIGGLSVARNAPSIIMFSTLDYWSGPDEIVRSTDGGGSWKSIGNGPLADRDVNGAQWLYFRNSRLSATGWAGDLEIDPFNPNRVLHVTGQGVWWSDDVGNVDQGQRMRWSFRDDGLEESVPLDLVSPPSGPPLLSGVGDIAGFRHDDLERSPPSGMFDNPRFNNTSSLDFAQNEPNLVVRTGSINTGLHGAYSTDGGTSWTPFATEPSGNTGQGSIAISADGTTILWSPSPRSTVPVYSRDRGQTWTACSGVTASMRVASDRVNPNKFYAVSGGVFSVSVDAGVSFTAGSVTGLAGGSRPRTVFGVEGDVWLVTGQALWHSTDSGTTFTSVTGVEAAIAVGFGMPAPSATYPAIYLTGTVAGVRGIFRSDDAGQQFVRIDDDRHQFGWPRAITGDPRVCGRVYLGTSGRGILYGEPP